jgi:FkbM family methyltransferase
MLNDRPISFIARNMLRPSNYLALLQMLRIYEHPFAGAARYFVGAGEYPCTMGVRTPMGVKTVTLFHRHDAITVHEIFCRQDYRSPSPAQVVIDIGSNIGISALYFLTRSPTSFCELYEPDPDNVAKLLTNLKGYEHRFTLHENAVADSSGVLPFIREPSGRYGSLVVPPTSRPRDAALEPGSLPDPGTEERIEVRVEHVNDVLAEALATHGSIDLLKIDTEGVELATVLAIDPALRARIRRIVIEWFDRHVSLDGFDVSSSCDTIMFTNRSM